MTTKTRKYKIQDAFPAKKEATEYAKTLRSRGDTAQVKKITPQGGYGGYLKWGVFSAGPRKKKKK